MISFFKKVWGDKRGNSLAIAAASFPLIIGAAGLATDTIQWTLWKRQLQRAADSAAIAGVYDRESANGATTNTAATVSHETANFTKGYAFCSGDHAYAWARERRYMLCNRGPTPFHIPLSWASTNQWRPSSSSSTRGTSSFHLDGACADHSSGGQYVKSM